MNQENKVPHKANATTKSSAEGLDLKQYSNLMPKTIAEIAEVQARGRKLFVKRPYSRKDPNALQNVKEKTKEEMKAEATQRQKEVNEYSKHIHYSSYYFDEKHEYRHVVLPKKLIRWLPHRGILTEKEWTSLGITQSTGWEHFMVYAPEPHILLFRREIEYLKKHGLDQLPVKQEKSQVIDKPQVAAKPLVAAEVLPEVAPVPSEVVPPIKRNMRLTRSSAANEKITK